MAPLWQASRCSLHDDLFHMDPGMVSLCLHELIPKTCPTTRSLKLQPRRGADERRLGIQDTPYRSSINTDCTVAPSTAATCQDASILHAPTHTLKHTLRLVKDYTHHIFVIVGGTWSQGQVNTFCLAAYEKSHLCGMYIKSISSVFASANWRKYEGVTFFASLQNLSFFVSLGLKKV